MLSGILQVLAIFFQRMITPAIAVIGGGMVADTALFIKNVAVTSKTVLSILKKWSYIAFR